MALYPRGGRSLVDLEHKLEWGGARGRRCMSEREVGAELWRAGVWNEGGGTVAWRSGDKVVCGKNKSTSPLLPCLTLHSSFSLSS